MQSIKIDAEFKNLIPPLTTEEYKQLEENLIKEGCRDSLIIWNGTMIDGHNRYEMCTKYNIPFKTTEMNFSGREEAVEWIIKNQFGRRNLPNYERAKLALRLEPIVKAKAKEKQIEEGRALGGTLNLKSEKGALNTDKELAKIASIGKDTIYKVRAIEKEATEEIKEKARKGEISVNKAYNLTRNPQPESEESEMRTCIMCGKEKAVSSFYGRDNECKECKNSRNGLKISRKEARELNELYPDEVLEKIYEDMKNPTPKALEAGKEKHFCNPIIAEYEEILNSFIDQIRKFTYMPQVKECETSKSLTNDAIEVLKKIIN